MSDVKKLFDEMLKGISPKLAELAEQEASDFILLEDPKYRAWDFDNERYYYSDRFPNLGQFYNAMQTLNAARYNLVYQPYLRLNDINGREIYHGDIIEISDEHIEIFGADRKFCLAGLKDGSAMYGRGFAPFNLNTYLWMVTKDGCRGCTVRGTIFENPELLQFSGEKAHMN